MIVNDYHKLLQRINSVVIIGCEFSELVFHFIKFSFWFIVE